MELNEILLKRRSVRKFLDKKVDRGLLLELIKSATQAPDACNLQLTQYLILDDSEIIKKLREVVGEKFSLSPAYIMVLKDSRFGNVRSAGVMSAGMAVENISLKAIDLGLATCAMAGFGNDRVIRRILSIPKHIDILLVLAVGYPDNSAHKESIPKLEVGEISSFNGYGNLSFLNSSIDLDRHSVHDVVNYRRRIAPVYLDRFKLNTFDRSFYDRAADFFVEKILPKNSGSGWRILDLMSYDGLFLKALREKTAERKLEIIASDYLNPNLSFFEKKLGVKKTRIGESNELLGLGDNSVDAVSLAFQADFIPKLDLLLSEAFSKLRPGGYFFAAVIEDTPWKNIAKKAVALFESIFLLKKRNIYENNPFFKEGPYKKINQTELARRLKKAGYTSITVQKVPDNAKNVIISYCLARK